MYFPSLFINILILNYFLIMTTSVSYLSFLTFASSLQTLFLLLAMLHTFSLKVGHSELGNGEVNKVLMLSNFVNLTGSFSSFNVFYSNSARGLNSSKISSFGFVTLLFTSQKKSVLKFFLLFTIIKLEAY